MQSPETVNNFETPSSKPNIIPETSTTKNQNNIQIFCKDLSKINDLDECGWTPLYRSIISGDVSSTLFLLNNGADPNIKCTMGETPLYQAVEMEKIDHIKLLLKKGADPNITNDDDISPLHIAVNKQNISIVKILLKYGANPNIKSKLYQQTPLHLAIKNNADPIFLLLLVQFNGSLLKEDKFNKKPVDYTNSKEMQNTIEKLKFGKEEQKIEKIKEVEKFETPSKKNELTLNNIYSNTIRSQSKGKELIISNSNAILQNPGNVKLTIIDGKNNIFSNDKNEISTSNNNKPKETIKKELFNLNKENIKNIQDTKNENKIITEENKENIDKNLNIDEYKKSIEESVELEDVNLNSKEIDYSLLRKKTGKFYDENQNENINNNLNESDNNIMNNSLRPKSIKLNINGLKPSDIDNNNNNNNQKKSIRFSFSSNTFKNNKIKTNISKSIEENNQNKENIDYNTNDINNTNNQSTKKENQKKTFKKELNNNKKKKKIIIKKFFNKEETGNIKNKKINFDKNKCLYEKIIKKSITKIEIYDDIKESTNQTMTKDTNTNREESKSNTSVKSLYNKPILKQKKIYNLKKQIKNEQNRDSLSVKLNNSIISSNSTNNLPKKNIFLKKEKNQNKQNKNLSFTRKNIVKENNININTINSDNNKNRKTCSMSRGSMTTLTASANEYLKNMNIKNSQSQNNQNNLWKFGNDNIYNDKSIYQSLLSNNLNSETSNEYNSNNNKYPIYDWLKEIGLHCYYNLFKEKKIFSMEKVISNLKSGKYVINKNDIEKIGIIINGHIYRIITKLEIDSEKINPKISGYFLNGNKRMSGKDINILNNSIYFCCGCCTSNERSIYNKIKKEFNLEKWLNKIGMIKYKENFVENGFDLFHYFILQMFSTVPVDDHILKEDLGIENDKDRDIILLRLNKDIKYILLKTGDKFGNELIINEKQVYEFDSRQTSLQNEESSECIIV